jgi:trehalose monomycolate/heme transporter
MFERWGHLVVRGRWWVMAGAMALVILGATWGTGVFSSLTSGGFVDNASNSGKVRAQIVREFGSQDPDVLVIYSSPTLSVNDSAFRDAVTNALTRAHARAEVAGIESYYSTQSPDFVSADGHHTYAVVQLASGSDDRKLAEYRAVKSAFQAGGGITTQYAGARPLFDEVNRRTESDIKRAETLSMPILLVLLVIIFRSVVAAITPLVVGGLAVLGGFVVVRLIATATGVSTFAINIITLIGLGLAIDYALFIVSRFREELDAGRSPADAVVRTMSTAGRTVAVSGVTVTLALGGLLLFPQLFLKSMGYGAMAAVVVAMVASLTVLPAGLAMLGPRINSIRVPWPCRRAMASDTDTGAWARLAHNVMARPWLYLIGVLAVLGILAAPVVHIKFGGIDARVVPASAPVRAATDELTRDFPAVDAAPIQVLVTAPDQSAVAGVLSDIRTIPGVTGAMVSQARGDSTLVTVNYHGKPTDTTAHDIVVGIRDLKTPPGVSVGVTGATADLTDELQELADHLPWMVLYVVLVTCVLLFLAFGSVILPIKAVLMNAVSLGAAFGAVVFIIQDGHFASWLGFTPTGVIEPTNPILMIVVLFGLATDYEVFLLSRVREEWDNGNDNTTAVAVGLQRTGRIITSAAALLVIVVIGFASGQIAFVKLIGIGMIVAIFVDATLVRALLVPATMRLLGKWNWWAPGALARVHRRYGIHEAPPAVREKVTV